MKKKIIEWIYRLPIIRGIIKQLHNLQKDTQKNAELIAELKKQNKEQNLSFQKQIDMLKLELSNTQKDLRTLKQETEFVKNELIKEINYKYYKGLLPTQYPDNLKEWYFEKTGEQLDLNNPETYNEKIQWMKLFNSTPEKTRLADKYLVREFIKEKIGEQYLVPLIDVWDTVEDIDFNKLPNRFVLKANHGSSWNIIVQDKSNFDEVNAKAKLKKWISTNFAFCNGLEMHYSNIKPRIIAEEYIENMNGELNDYKVFCFNGKAKYIRVLTGCQTKLKMAFYDTDWNLMPFVYSYERLTEKVSKPDNLDELIQLSEKLAKGFSHVRIDFYRLNNGEFKFGEMTFTHTSGICRWDPPEYNKILGDMISLDTSRVNEEQNDDDSALERALPYSLEDVIIWKPVTNPGK